MNRAAAFLGLVSAVFAAGCLVLFIYLHVRLEVQQCQPHISVLCVFGVKGAIGISLGVGTFVVFMGLGIIDSINHKGTLVQYWFVSVMTYSVCADLSLPRTHYIASVWAFAIFKWGLTAFYYALKTFRKMSRNQFRPLEEPADDVSGGAEDANNNAIQS